MARHPARVGKTVSRAYTKLFSSITESTVWAEPLATRVVWITMLAMADRHGRVWAAVPGLANRARVTIDETEAALARFMAPDRYSRTPDNEGRRIEPIDGGWRLLNHAKYREMRDEEERREYKRAWDREHRSKPTNPTKSDRARPRPTKAAPAPEADSEAGKSNPSAPSASRSTPAGEVKDHGQVVERIPLNDGSEFDVQQSFVDELDRLYPAVDPVQTLREIRGWNLAHPNRRKTRRGVRAHIVSWFTREQDRHSSRAS